MGQAAAPQAGPAPFGTVFLGHMAVTRWAHGVWEEPTLQDVAPLALHPAAHVLHYGSACFEGLKAHRGVDGVVRVFRLDRHARRLQQSAEALVLPPPPVAMLTTMVLDVVRAGLADVPDPPGSLYLRPTLIGTDANIGAAAHPAHEATLFVLASPVGDYFAGGRRALSVAIETTQLRTTPQFGTVKTGANYAMALGVTTRAAAELGVDQVLFAPGGQVQETGASNILLLDEGRIVTPALSPAFLHGVTRHSVLALAADLGYQVEERDLEVAELLAWAARPGAEVALAGTAAVLAPVGSLVHAAGRTLVGDGGVGAHTVRLHDALGQLQRAERPDPHGWLTPVLP